MNYTITQFKNNFPDDDACLDYIFKARFDNPICPKCGKTGFYRIKTRRCYACSCGYQIYPVSGTIFHKSDTKLTDWFFAIYLMSQANNGVSAKEIQRHLGTTYKTAWRIAKLIRSLMKQDKEILGGTVEADETFVGGKKRGVDGTVGKTPVMGIVQRGGKVKSKKIPDVQTHTLLGMLRENVKFGSNLITDECGIYKKSKRLGLFHNSVCHSKNEYGRGNIHTNTIEGFFSQIKRSIYGTYHAVSPKHLQSYVDEASFHYNARFSSVSVFEGLLLRLCELPYQGGQKMPAFEVRVSS